ncbi:MAG TPA: 6-phosphogluconolactonase, partial [Anaerolineae bacterium]|nr:6-phosphogluconolactonase [Anaerolineae bacterium]
MDNNEIDIFVFAEKGDVAAEGARLFVEKAAEAIAERGRFGVVLAGGSTPAAMYQLLQQEAWQRQVDWERVHVFWGDERFVAPDHTLNSWREATELFLGQVPIPAENVWPMPTVGLGVGEAAEVYESRLRSFFGQEEPRFDLIFLGMGADGHTASLFPGRAGVLEEDAWVVGVEG